MLPANATRNWSAALPIRSVRAQAAAVDINPVPVNRNMFTTLPTVHHQGQYQEQPAGANIRGVPVRRASVRELTAVRNITVRPVRRFAKRPIRTTVTNARTITRQFTAA